MDRLTYLQCVNKDYQLALKQLNKRDLFEYCRAVLLCCPPCVIQDLRKCNLGRKRTTSKVWGTATAAKLASVSATMSRIASCGRPQDPPAGSSSASNIASGTCCSPESNDSNVSPSTSSEDANSGPKDALLPSKVGVSRPALAMASACQNDERDLSATIPSYQQASSTTIYTSPSNLVSHAPAALPSSSGPFLAGAYYDDEPPVLRSPPPLTADDNARDHIVVMKMHDPEALLRKAMATTLGAGYKPAVVVMGFSA